MATFLDIATMSMQEIGALSQGEVPTSAEAEFCRVKANMLLDEWNARKPLTYNVTFDSFTLTANLSPHTIGPSGTFGSLAVSAASQAAACVLTVPVAPPSGTLVLISGATLNWVPINGYFIVTKINATTFSIAVNTTGLGALTGAVVVAFILTRPVSILGANLILNTATPNVYQPIVVRDKAWWLNQRVPTLASGIPTDLYYSPDWPNGSLWLWPVPQIAYGLQLELSLILNNFPALTSAFSMPPGYQSALMYNLAESLCPSFGREVTAQLEKMARRARGAIVVNNTNAPRIVTKDAGVPGSGGNRSNWNWHTGLTR